MEGSLESSQLLDHPRVSYNTDIEQAARIQASGDDEILPKTNSDIMKYIFATAYPIACALVLEVSCNFVMLFFASRVRNSDIAPEKIFAGISLSIMFANVTCFSIHEGMTGAVEV